MNICFNSNSNTLHVSKFIFSKQTSQLEKPELESIFPYDEEALFCEFSTYNVPVNLPNWVDIEDQGYFILGKEAGSPVS